MRINFTCPTCGSNEGIEQEVNSTVVVSKVYEINSDGSVQTDVQEVCGRELHTYVCAGCGWVICDDLIRPTRPTELFTWLKQRGMLQE